jgi:hypothetical protein
VNELKSFLGLDLDLEEQEEIETYYISEVIEEIEEGDVYIAMDNKDLVITLSDVGSLVHAKTGASIQLTAAVLGERYYLKEKERVEVPMSLALNAFNNGQTIELEYQGRSVCIIPGVEESLRPFVHFDSIVEGTWYIID